MKININRIDDAFLMEAVNETGNKARMDASPTLGAAGEGVRPMEMLLMGVGGCSAIDIVHILRKQRLQLDDLNISVEAERKDEVPAIFDWIHLTFHLKGEVPDEKAIRATELSMEKYCSVSRILEKSATLYFSLVVNGNQLITKKATDGISEEI